MKSIAVEALVSDARPGLGLSLIAGEGGLTRRIGNARIQKPGLALAGFTRYIHPERVQVIGFSEISYLESLDERARVQAIEDLASTEVCAIVVTRGQPLPPALLAACARRGIPLLRTDLLSSTFIVRLQDFLEAALVETTTLHGNLVDVVGVGILLLGKSGIGKSECALDLILKGHRLVADDIVEIHRREPDTVIGRAAGLIKHHMEIRGLGIINVKDLFGVASIGDEARIDLVIELMPWEVEQEYDRLGLVQQTYPILGVNLPLLTMPVSPGRNMTTIIEIAARNHLLKMRGHDPAAQMHALVAAKIAEATTESDA